MRHLRPDHMPITVTPPEQVGPELPEWTEGELVQLDRELDDMLACLRVPFPPDQVEKLPKPMWRGAWDGEAKGRCDVCGGYHVLANTIHLDYIGHAGVTQRLLEVDPLWGWEPLAYTEQGLPAFDKFGGLWIKLTVCGVTRLGYGDAAGKDPGTTAVKEIIGDAIRNAAMRFGVALELWSKIDRHEGKNPGATSEAPRQQRSTAANPRRNPPGGEQPRGGQTEERATPHPKTQDALDALHSACDEHGYSTEYAIERWNKLHPDTHITKGKPEDIVILAAKLIEESVGDEPGPADEKPVVSDGGDAPDGKPLF